MRISRFTLNVNYGSFSHIEFSSYLLNCDLLISRYKDYRDPPWKPDAYTFSKEYWSVLAAKLAFVIFFQVLKLYIQYKIHYISSSHIEASVLLSF